MKGHISQKKLLRKGKAGLARSGQKENLPWEAPASQKNPVAGHILLLFAAIKKGPAKEGTAGAFFVNGS